MTSYEPLTKSCDSEVMTFKNFPRQGSMSHSWLMVWCASLRASLRVAVQCRVSWCFCPRCLHKYRGQPTPENFGKLGHQIFVKLIQGLRQKNGPEPSLSKSISARTRVNLVKLLPPVNPENTGKAQKMHLQFSKKYQQIK